MNPTNYLAVAASIVLQFKFSTTSQTNDCAAYLFLNYAVRCYLIY